MSPTEAEEHIPRPKAGEPKSLDDFVKEEKIHLNDLDDVKDYREANGDPA